MTEPQNSLSRWLIAVFILVFFTVLSGSVWFYYTQEQQLRQDAEANLQAIARLKVHQIATWRNELLNDAAECQEGPCSAEMLLHWLANQSAGSTALILDHFRVMQKYHHYSDVRLVDAVGQVRLSLSGHSDPLPPDISQALALAFHTHHPILTDLYAVPTGSSLYLETITPLYAANGQPAGALMQQNDASEFLFPLVAAWPTPSQSAETLLVRRDGDAVLFLNELRHQTNTALKLRIPLNQINVPAVMAVLGQTGVVQGYDYRGVEVLSVLQPVPDSPWYMIAKIDKAEALAAWSTRSALILSLLAGLIVALVATAGVVWQRNQKAHYHALFRAEATRRESEEKFRIIIETSPDSIVQTDLQGHFITANQRFLEIYRYHHIDELHQAGVTVFDLIAPPDRERAWANTQKVLAAGQDFNREYISIRKDGTLFPIELSTSLILNVEGQPAFFVIITRDITARKQTEEALRQKTEELDKFFSNTLDLLCITDTAGYFRRLNAEWETTLGYPLEELINRRFLDFVHPADLDSTLAAITELDTQKPVLNFINRYRCRDGSYRWIEWRSYPVGQLVYAAARDITEHKQIEETLARALAERNTLLRELQHRIKNTFTMMISLIELEAEQTEDAGARAVLENLNRRIYPLTNLYSMLSTGGDTQKIRLDWYLGEIADTLVGTFVDNRERVTLQLNLAEIIVSAKSAPPLGLILNELLTNAFKYAFPGNQRGMVKVDLRRNHGEVVLAVTNSGVGLPADFDLSRSPGLGLTLTRMLAQQLGGEVYCESNAETRFVVRVKET